MLQNPFTQTPAKIAVIGLGYVGLPLAVAFAQHHEVVGFDIGARRIAELSAGADRTREVSREALAAAKGLRITGEAADMQGCNAFIVTVQTPTDGAQRTDTTATLAAIHLVCVANSQGRGEDSAVHGP